MKATEEQLSADIRAGRLARVYFLYGKEPFLVKTYTDRLIKKAVGSDPLDFNLIRVSGNPDSEALSEYVEGLPVFADMKMIVINDADAEKMDADTLNHFISVISDVPETCILVFSITALQTDEKKAKTKKLIAAVDKAGVVCRLDSVAQSKIAELVVKKAAKQGVVISYGDASYLTERVLCNMTLVSEETAKLISCAGTGGTITREMIDSLVAKQLDTSIYELAAAINSGKRADAFRIVDDLFFERIESVVILSALSGAYLDFYRAKLAKASGVLPGQAAAEFSYPKNREWVFGKAMNAVTRLKTGYLRETIAILFRADIAMKSSAADSRTILERAVAELFAAREKSD